MFNNLPLLRRCGSTSKRKICLLLILSLVGVYYYIVPHPSAARIFGGYSYHHKPLLARTEEEREYLDRVYNMSRVATTVDIDNVTFLDNYYRYNYQAIDERIKRRMERVDEVCRQIGQSRSWEYNLYQFNTLHMSWCPVFKSSSTTWKNYFIDWQHGRKKSRTSNHINLLAKRRLAHDMEWLRSLLGTTLGYWGTMNKGKQTYEAEDDNNLRFTVVRHPFERLLSHVNSASRNDEMVKMRLSWIQDAMITGRINTIDKDNRKKFKDELIQYFRLLSRHRSLQDFSGRSRDNPYLNPPYPLVGELIDHIRFTGHSDGHWMPASQYCNICIHKFDYIIKLEEEPLELWYLVEKLGLWDDRLVFLNRANSSAKKTTERKEVLDQLANLSQEQKHFVDKYFDVDFRMFGYTKLS